MTARCFLAVLLVALLPTAALANPAEVEASFEAYKQALVEGDGARASELTASDTHAFVKQTLDRALTMEEPALRALPLLDQISVLMLRHNMKPEQLRAMKDGDRSEEHTSELQSLMRISYAVFCLKKKNKQQTSTWTT